MVGRVHQQRPRSKTVVGAFIHKKLKDSDHWVLTCTKGRLGFTQATKGLFRYHHFKASLFRIALPTAKTKCFEGLVTLTVLNQGQFLYQASPRV